jgi:hypothetical protein
MITKKQGDRIFFGILALVPLWFLIGYSLDLFPHLNKSTVAVVTEVEVSYNIRFLYGSARYEFTVNGKKIKGGYQANTNNRKSLNCLVGHHFPVLYDEKNPEYSQLLVTKQDFYFHSEMPYPDSLKWVCDFFYCE